MLICGIDFETSGRLPKTHSIVEVGMVLWETELNTPVQQAGFLVYTPNAIWEPGATEKNHITQQMCLDYGKEEKAALHNTIAFYQKAHMMCAHNGNIFDRPFFEAWCQKFGYREVLDDNKTWLDTKIDLPVPDDWSKKLDYLATHFGITPKKRNHRGVSDVETMLDILSQCPLDKVIESAKSPTIIVEALVDFDNNALAKLQGFYWRPAPIKKWIKAIKSYRLKDVIESAAAQEWPEDLDPEHTKRPGFRVRIAPSWVTG